METILIVSPELDFKEIEHWAQGLIGNYVPGYEDYIAEKIIQFQISEHFDRYDELDYVIVYALIEVKEK